MSGGYFEYIQYRFTDMYEDIQQVILSNLMRIHDWYFEKETPPATSDKEFCEFCRVANYCRSKYGENLFVPTMGKKWEEFNIGTTRAKKYKKTSQIVTRVKKIGKKREKRVARDPRPTLDDKFVLGKHLSDNTDYYIHPMVFNKHAAILGASGSGKTWLGKKIIEEALIQGFPALMIDPQGDLCSIVLPDDETSKYADLVKRINWKIYTPGSEKGIKLSINPLETPAKESLEELDYRNAILDNTSLLIQYILDV